MPFFLESHILEKNMENYQRLIVVLPDVDFTDNIGQLTSKDY